MPFPDPDHLSSLSTFLEALVQGGSSSLDTSPLTEDCPICLRPYYQPNFDEDEEEMYYGSCEEPVEVICGHFFGNLCLLRWMSSMQTAQITCPLCRAALFSLDELEDMYDEADEDSDEGSDERPSEEPDQETDEETNNEEGHGEQPDGDDVPDCELPPDGSVPGEENSDDEVNVIDSAGVGTDPEPTGSDGYPAGGNVHGGEYSFEDVFETQDVGHDMDEDLDQGDDEDDITHVHTSNPDGIDIFASEPIPAFLHPVDNASDYSLNTVHPIRATRLFHLPHRPYTRPYTSYLDPQNFYSPSPHLLPPHPLLYSGTAIEKAITASSLAIKELEAQHQKWMCEVAEISVLLGGVGLW